MHKKDLLNSLTLFKENQIICDEASLLTMSIDASFYNLNPKAIIDVNSNEQVLELMQQAKKLTTSLTFRAAGTSLSGQAQGDGIIVRINKSWKEMEVLNSGAQIKLQPGVIGSHANDKLFSYKKKIGPDPASIKSCMIGGIVANNASGMCCGTHQNSYQTLDSIKFILPPRKGKKAELIDTSLPRSKEDFLKEHYDLAQKITQIKHEILASHQLQQLIKTKYQIKNTMGYSLNAFIDYEHPLDILSHLLVGSEGTLGFISEVTLNTLKNDPYRCCALAFFPNIKAACEAASSLDRSDVISAELMDRASLRSIEDKPGIPSYIRDFPNEVTALLLEVRSENQESLKKEQEKLKQILKRFALIREPEISIHARDYNTWWDIRKGLLPSTGKSRPVGTTLIIEDIAFKKEDFPQATHELVQLLQKYYSDAILFGHALDTNLHFVFAQDFNNEQATHHYKKFMQELADLVGSKWKGSLKAEHGTGRNMSPFIIQEWGDHAYNIMKDIKSFIDPDNILNPGVIINSNENAHIENLKTTPAVDPLIDHCIDCGFCEPTCPSKDLTLTPRLRISAFRRLQAQKKLITKKRLKSFISYNANSTCATDGMCAIACPVDIDTGLFIKKYRSKSTPLLKDLIATAVQKNFSKTLSLSRASLYCISLIPNTFLTIISKLKIFSYLKWLPRPNFKKIKSTNSLSEKKVIYLISCISRTMGPSSKDNFKKSLPEVFLSILKKSNYDVIIPKNIDNLCCGLPFESKGLLDQAQALSNKIEQQLVELSNHGQIPIVIDNSPCSYRLKKVLNKKFHIYDSIEFTDKIIQPNIAQTNEPISIHATCSSQKMDIDQHFINLATSCSTNVTQPAYIKCCGFAGDKGFSAPELNDSALSTLKAQVSNCTQGFCSSRTCEIGLSKNSEIPYQSLLYLIDNQMH